VLPFAYTLADTPTGYLELGRGVKPDNALVFRDNNGAYFQYGCWDEVKGVEMKPVSPPSFDSLQQFYDEVRIYNADGTQYNSLSVYMGGLGLSSGISAVPYTGGTKWLYNPITQQFVLMTKNPIRIDCGNTPVTHSPPTGDNTAVLAQRWSVEPGYCEPSHPVRWSVQPSYCCEPSPPVRWSVDANRWGGVDANRWSADSSWNRYACE
jgi:hypothetical protein